MSDIKVIANRSDIVAIADAVRNKTGQSNEMTLGEIAHEVYGIETGIDTSGATATASDILEGKTAYANGEKVTGTIATKNSSDLIASGATITVPAGYYSTQASKTVATATQATPSVTINSSTGLVAATATQTAGYVAAGSKSGTLQLAFQPAKTITPSTTSQVAVSSGYYTGGNVTVAGDANLVADNIKKGTSIFGVDGNYEGSGEADYSVEDGLITRTLTTYSNDRVETIGSYAFYWCTSLTNVNFPVCKNIKSYAFYDCSSLTSVNFPTCISVGDYAFYSCSKLISVSFPACVSIGTRAFAYCDNITSVDFPHCKTIDTCAFSRCNALSKAIFGENISSASINDRAFIGESAFSTCTRLTNLTLYYPSVVRLSNINAFNSTPMSVSTYTDSFGSIYVPASLVAAYKSATNWATYAARIAPIGGTEDSGGANLIAFTIDGTSYQAEEGMTWGAWVNSEYNTANFTLDEDNWVCHPDGGYVGDQMGMEVYSHNLIIENKAYLLH